MAHMHFSIRDELRDVPFWKYPFLLPFLAINDNFKEKAAAPPAANDYNTYILILLTILPGWPFYLVYFLSPWIGRFIFRLLRVRMPDAFLKRPQKEKPPTRG